MTSVGRSCWVQWPQPGSQIGQAKGRTHVYLVGPRLYQVLIFGPAARMPPETIDGFLNSFALLDPIPGPGGTGVAVGTGVGVGVGVATAAT